MSEEDNKDTVLSESEKTELEKIKEHAQNIWLWVKEKKAIFIPAGVIVGGSVMLLLFLAISSGDDEASEVEVATPAPSSSASDEFQLAKSGESARDPTGTWDTRNVWFIWNVDTSRFNKKKHGIPHKVRKGITGAVVKTWEPKGEAKKALLLAFNQAGIHVDRVRPFDSDKLQRVDHYLAVIFETSTSEDGFVDLKVNICAVSMGQQGEDDDRCFTEQINEHYHDYFGFMLKLVDKVAKNLKGEGKIRYIGESSEQSTNTKG